ncbi:unnamed protein product [Porites lobata]|uniref:Uncharacterized protein n=1 Tax=Porites lobata TaxID=104759 RepID=A0ABN8NSZ7_9CNID|nr:unnamed protein product [Porites lobata]
MFFRKERINTIIIVEKPKTQLGQAITSHHSSTTPFIGEVMNETESFPDESESSRICIGNILGPAEHSSRKGTDNTTKSLIRIPQ